MHASIAFGWELAWKYLQIRQWNFRVSNCRIPFQFFVLLIVLGSEWKKIRILIVTVLVMKYFSLCVYVVWTDRPIYHIKGDVFNTGAISTNLKNIQLSTPVLGTVCLSKTVTLWQWHIGTWPSENSITRGIRQKLPHRSRRFGPISPLFLPVVRVTFARIEIPSTWGRGRGFLFRLHSRERLPTIPVCLCSLLSLFTRFTSQFWW